MANLGETTFLHRWFQEVWNEGNEAAIDSLAAPDVVFHSLRGGLRGREAFKQFYRSFRSVLSDFHFEIVHAIGHGEYQTVYCRVTAIQKATRKPVQFVGGGVGRVVGGKLVEAWDAWDFLHLAEQMKEVPSGSFEKLLSSGR